jgi:hypothetical protein
VGTDEKRSSAARDARLGEVSKHVGAESHVATTPVAVGPPAFDQTDALEDVEVVGQKVPL